MTKKKQAIAERAVWGAIGGWVHGYRFLKVIKMHENGYASGTVIVIVEPESVKKMLADERKAKKGKKP